MNEISAEEMAVFEAKIPGYVIEAARRLYSDDAQEADALVYAGYITGAMLKSSQDAIQDFDNRGKANVSTNSSALLGFSKLFSDKGFHSAALLVSSAAYSLHLADLCSTSMSRTGYSKGPEQKTYVVKNSESGLIKIGKSMDVGRRVKSLQCGSGSRLFLLAVFDADIEQDLHKLCSDLRVFGEWFSSPDVVLSRAMAFANNLGVAVKGN